MQRLSPAVPPRPSSGSALRGEPEPSRVSSLRPDRVSEDELDAAECSRLVGLYHGYDAARRALARVVSEFGSARALEQVRRRQESRPRLGGGLAAFFEPAAGESPVDLRRATTAAHSAALASFAAVSDKAELILAQICRRWPELRGELGGPLSTDHIPFDPSLDPSSREAGPKSS